MAHTIFSEDFERGGPGFRGPIKDSWSIGGSPISAGRWQLFYPEYGEDANETPGSGRYAAVKSSSPEFIDTLVWIISPLINVQNYNQLKLSADIYLKSNGLSPGEDTLTVTVLTISGDAGAMVAEQNEIEVIGQNMSGGDSISENRSWDLSAVSDNSHMIQVAFSFYSSVGGSPSVQIDNIELTGEEIGAPAAPTGLRVET